jgi:TldD protein
MSFYVSRFCFVNNFLFACPEKKEECLVRVYRFLCSCVVATAFFSVVVISSVCAQSPQDHPVLQALRAEMQRTLQEFKKEPHPPYFLGYAVTEVRSITFSASFGDITFDDANVQRTLDIDLRVGSYQTDNTRQLRGSNFEQPALARGTQFPIGNDIPALRSALWLATDRQYKSAVERYVKVVSNQAVKVKEEDASADFSQSTPVQAIEQLPVFTFDSLAWKNRLKRLSRLFTLDPAIYQGEVFLRAEITTRWFVNSEGTTLQTGDTYIRVFAQGMTKADDGMTLPLYRSYFAFTPEGLPSEQAMAQDITTVVGLLSKLRTAPLIETFSGPAILSGEAAGVFFHEIFGHRIEGHRQKDVRSSQTFKNLVGEKILPDFVDVVFDPSVKTMNGRDVVGYYRYDDEGVPGQKVTAVKDGAFLQFLMSRSPIERFTQSNGHGRRQSGFGVVARQSNLMVQARHQVPFDSLRILLRTECKKQGKEFGLYFVEISGGFTFTQRTLPNAFNVQPLLVYKIFADGRPDELVRGVDLIGTPLTTFKQIQAAANDLGIFNGVCGAESGGVPVSASSPSLLVSVIEAQKKAKSQAKPPILPSPIPAQKDN